MMFSPVSQISVNCEMGESEGNQETAPFDVKWLAEHFNFECSDLIKAKFDSIGVMFEVYFKPGKELIADQFYNTLIGKGCHPQYYKFNNSVCLNKFQKEKILSAGLSTFTTISDQSLISQEQTEKSSLLNALTIRDQILLPQPKIELKESQQEKLIAGAMLGQNFIPPIENAAAIDNTLRKGILLAKLFLEVLPSAQAMKRFYEQDQDSSWVQACGEHCQQANAKVDRFLNEIDPHLSFIKEILSNSDYKKKLEYYFITEENLISKLERFVKNPNNSLHQALINNCYG